MFDNHLHRIDESGFYRSRKCKLKNLKTNLRIFHPLYQLPLGPLHRIATRTVTVLLSRLTLFVVGVYWIPVEVVRRRKG